MSITYPLDLPTDTDLTKSNLIMVNAISTSQSPFTFKQQVYKWQGERWDLEVSLPLMERATAEKYITFLAKLKGSYGTFTAYVPSGTDRLSAWSIPTTVNRLKTEGDDYLKTEGDDYLIADYGNIVVYGANQTGSSLYVSGYTKSTSNVAVAGDYLQLGTGSNTRLYKILQNANSNAAGEATLEIWPNIQITPSHGSTVIFDTPKGLYRLNQNSVSIYSDYRNLYSIEFTASGVV